MARRPGNTAKTAMIGYGGGGANVTPHLEIGSLKPAGRITRRPVHSFQIRTRPWVIQPFAIAPVLPGETLTNALMQVRAVTDPIKNPLIGWWNEYYLFYVKHRDLSARDTLIDMHLTNASISSLNAATATRPTYHYGAAPNWTQLCLESVVEWYFRDDGEAWNVSGSTVTIDSVVMPLAKLSERKWWDSLKLEVTVPTSDSGLPGEVSQLPPHMTAFSAHYDQWRYMRENSLTEATFEDFLKTFGVKASKAVSETEFRPELIRYVRDWTYPSNTIDPATGAPTSACSWAVAERADKDRFFQEPGFIFGVTVTRPKVYLGNQLGAAASMLDNAFAWLPAVMRDDPYTSLIEFDNTEGPIAGTPNVADDYWVDARDLFLYGDQFVNFAMTGGLDDSCVALPSSSGSGVLQKNYVASTDMNNLFVDDDASDNKNQIRMDGVLTLNVLSHLRDTT